MSAPTITHLESPTLSDGDFDDNLDHWFCSCNEDRAMCGADIAGEPETPPVFTPDDCRVCLDLIDQPCERCGE